MYMDLRKWWDGHAEVVSLIGFAGVTAQIETIRKERKGKKRKRKEKRACEIEK